MYVEIHEREDGEAKFLDFYVGDGVVFTTKNQLASDALLEFLEFAEKASIYSEWQRGNCHRGAES